jgi:hypothetical protein
VSYLLLIVEPIGQRAERSDAEGRDVYDDMVRFGQDLQSRGILRGAESLKSTEDGVRVQRRGGQATLIDGPFAEAKEMIGGFFLLDVATRDEAIAIANECPAAGWCTVEVREVGPCFA